MSPALSPARLALELLAAEPAVGLRAAALIRAGALFELQPGALRVALTRLVAEGRVIHAARGHYRLGALAAARQRSLDRWRRGLDAGPAGRGGLFAVASLGALKADRGAQRRLGSVVRRLGCVPLGPELYVRPDNLRGGLAKFRARAEALGLEPRVTTFAIRGGPPALLAEVRRRYRPEALERGYRAMARRLAAAERSFTRAAPERAARRALEVGAAAIRLLAEDPWLPDDWVDPGPRRQLVADVARFERIGRALWAAILARCQPAPVRRQNSPAQVHP